MTEVVLYDYFRSTASYRVRIALNLARIEYRSVTINLLEKKHNSQEHLKRNPQGFVPVLEIDGHQFTQSIAIVEYLNETKQLGLFPATPSERAHVRALAQIIASDIHPVCNLSVVSYAVGLAPGTEYIKESWMKHFIEKGLRAYETMLSKHAQNPYSYGDKPTLADLCIIPQLYNAKRWQVDYSGLTRICGVERACETIPAFLDAHPDRVKQTNV